MKHFRKISLVIGVIGLFIILGSAGASDCGENLTEILPVLTIGVSMSVMSFAYLYWYENKKNKKGGGKMRDELYMLRCKHKLTKCEMAERTGVSRTTYTLIENGERDGKKPFWEAVQREFKVSDADMWKLQKC